LLDRQFDIFVFLSPPSCGVLCVLQIQIVVVLLDKQQVFASVRWAGSWDGIGIGVGINLWGQDRGHISWAKECWENFCSISCW